MAEMQNQKNHYKLQGEMIDVQGQEMTEFYKEDIKLLIY